MLALSDPVPQFSPEATVECLVDCSYFFRCFSCEAMKCNTILKMNPPLGNIHFILLYSSDSPSRTPISFCGLFLYGLHGLIQSFPEVLSNWIQLHCIYTFCWILHSILLRINFTLYLLQKHGCSIRGINSIYLSLIFPPFWFSTHWFQFLGDLLYHCLGEKIHLWI